MKNHQTIIATTIVGLFVLASRACAAIMVTDGTLHVYCYDAFDIYAPFPYNFFPPQHVTLVDAPADQPFAAGYASAFIDWQAPWPYRGGAYLSAAEWSSFADGQVGIFTAPVVYGGGRAIASGNVNITEDAPETLRVRAHRHGGPLPFVGRVSLDAVGGGNVFDTGLDRSIFDGADLLVPLSPGQYTLTWNSQNNGFGTGYSDTGFDFTMSVPEPSALCLITAGAMVFMRQRGRGAGSTETRSNRERD